MSDISLEELLKSLSEAETKEDTKKFQQKDLYHMDRFIEEYDIKVGTTKVPTYIIFHAYRLIWKGVQSIEKKANKIKFFRSFAKRFPSSRIGKQRYYLLNEEAFDLTREGDLKAKHYDEIYTKNIKKKQDKKSKSKKEVQSKK